MAADIADVVIGELSSKATDGSLQEVLAKVKDDLTTRRDRNREKKKLHLLLLGSSGCGKTALSEVLINGQSKGEFGPLHGTKDNVVTKPVTENGIECFVHDTKGLGDHTNFENLLEEIRSVYREHQNECLIILCIKFSDRITDDVYEKLFEVCCDFAPNVWNNVIIAVTRSEVPPDFENYDTLKADWTSAIQSKMRSIGLTDEIASAVPICFTSHTGISNPIDKCWKKCLFRCIIERAQDSLACFEFVMQNLLASIESICKSGVSERVVIFNTSLQNLDLSPSDASDASLQGLHVSPLVENVLDMKGKLVTGATIGTAVGSVAGIGAGIAGAFGTGAATAASAAVIGSAGAAAGLAAFSAVTVATCGVGAGVGIGVGMLVAALIVWIYWRRQRNGQD